LTEQINALNNSINKQWQVEDIKNNDFRVRSSSLLSYLGIFDGKQSKTEYKQNLGRRVSLDKEIPFFMYDFALSNSCKLKQTSAKSVIITGHWAKSIRKLMRR
jgi:hypothetical protein